ncbi:HEPN domain-containing protein [candidate division KSB1 bacterium]
MNIDEKIKAQFDKLLNMGKEIRKIKNPNDKDNIPINFEMYNKWSTQTISFIEKVFTKESQHYNALIDRWNNSNKGRSWIPFYEFQFFNSVLEAAYNDYCGGYLFDVKDLITADVFDDFLEMAEYLLGESYEDASAVLIGGVLENALRKLCARNDIELPNNPKLNWMNQELMKKGVYNKLVFKQVTAWADIRNNAAHGNYNEYSKEDVEDMAKKVRRFITEYLA